MMSVQREKLNKDKVLLKGWLIDRFGGDPRRLQLFFVSDAGKSCYVK